MSTILNVIILMFNILILIPLLVVFFKSNSVVDIVLYTGLIVNSIIIIKTVL